MRPSLILLPLVLTITGILCQSFSPPSDEICPRDNVTFTCVVDSVVTLWTVSANGVDTQCAYSSDNPLTVTCGPGGRFESSRTDVNGPANNSSLSVDLITNDLNGITVSCIDGGTGVSARSYNICIIAIESVPEILPVIVTECNDDTCIVNVMWSEAFISCSGSVSQYVLSVTPPTSDCQSSSEDCVLMTHHTHYDLTLTVNETYILTVRADTCSNTLTGNYSDPVPIRINDDTRHNVAIPEYAHSGILETINLSWGAFFVQFNDTIITTYNYTVSLSPEYLVSDGDDQYTEAITNDTSYTFNIPSDVIAEYSPTVRVNIQGFTPVQFTSTPIFSEEVINDEDMFSVEVNSLCFATVTCYGEVQECTAYCGASEDIADLTNNMTSSISEGGGNISIQLPPPTGDVYYCIVSGIDSMASGSGQGDFRGRQNRTVTLDGCSLEQLLDTMNVADCDMNEDGESCSCTLNSDDSRYGVTYDSSPSETVAEYFTTKGYCFSGNEALTRMCTATSTWTGDMIDGTNLKTVSDEVSLSGLDIVLIVIGVIFLIIGLVAAITVGVLLGMKIKKCCGMVKWWYWLVIGIGIVLLITDIILWLALLGYSLNNNFSEDDGYLRKDDSSCISPPGKVKVRSCLVIGNFVCAFLDSVVWIVCLPLMKCGISTDPDSTDGGTSKSKKKNKKEPPSDDMELDKYDSLIHSKPTSPQPLLSDTDPGYSKLHQSSVDDSPEHYGKLKHPGVTQPMPVPAPTDSEYGKIDRTQIHESPDHYGKLDHGVKKKAATLPPPTDSEYGKLDRTQMHESPQHYGKLDHGIKKTVTLPPPSDSEYGKLDRSQMQDDPQHFGRLDHGVNKTSTLPGAVVPPTSEGYGKPDRTQMHIQSGQPGDMYAEVSNEPRHIPRAKQTSDTSSKSRRQRGQ